MSDLHIRYMIRRDLPQVVEIENESYHDPMTEVEFTEELRKRCSIGNVVEHDGGIVGYMIYHLHKRSLVVVCLTVAPRWRRKGVGTMMIESLVKKLNTKRRTIKFFVDERNLGGLLFLKANGFVATEVIRNLYEGADGIEMCFDADVKHETLPRSKR
jgi:ribosomal-protein-alanine N-acetyltransferase